MAIHICLARVTSLGSWTAIVPREYRDVRTLVVIPLGDTRFDFIDLDRINTPEYLQRKGGAFSLSFDKCETAGVYKRGDMTRRRIKHFGELA